MKMFGLEMCSATCSIVRMKCVSKFVVKSNEGEARRSVVERRRLCLVVVRGSWTRPEDEEWGVKVNGHLDLYIYILPVRRH